MDNKNRLVMVCASCKQASCWHGEFYCDSYKTANTELKTVAELKALKLEHPENWGLKKMREVYSQPAPFGFKGEPT